MRSQTQDFSDDALDREIDALLDVDPSPQFLPRIRAAVETQRHSVWRIPGVAAFGGLAAMALLIGLAVREERPPRPDAPVAVSAGVPAPHEITPANPPVRGPEILTATRAATVREHTRGQSAAGSPPEVLVPRGERDALQQLLLLSGREPLVIVPAAIVTQQTGGPPTPLVVPTIAIERLTPDSIDGGD